MTTTSPVIDLRSDTVTQPTKAMRQAMVDAPVGDDVFGEDPSVNRLQDVTAELLGKEAALYVPSGSMANQIAIKVHTQPGDEVLVGRNAHAWLFESGAAGAISGVQPHLIGDDGRFTADEVRAAFKQDDHHHAPTTLVSVENTHNMGGGKVWNQDDVRNVVRTASELGAATHLDGARLWNAAVSSGASEAELAADFDTVSVCLSKGLGAPVGSVLCGSKELIHKAHRVRKMLGGAMRQAGIIAAAGLYALEHGRPRLGEDHENARLLAEQVNAIAGCTVSIPDVHTNIVMVDLAAHAGTGAQMEAAAGTQGLLFCAMGPQRIRLVTHRDVDRAACQRAVTILTSIIAKNSAR